MKVKFKRDFFSPRGFRMRKGIWHENVPEDWKLPPGAEVDNSVPEPPKVEVKDEAEKASEELVAMTTSNKAESHLFKKEKTTPKEA